MNDILVLMLEKLKKPFWRVFMLSWITWNWQIWYLTIFMSSNDIKGNKLDYIVQKYSYLGFLRKDLEIFNINIYDILFPQIGIFIHWIFFPIVLSYLIVWYFPKITDQFLEKNKENKGRENAILAQEIKSETRVIKAKKENLEEKEKLAEIEDKNIYEDWDKDFAKLESFTLHTLSKLIYSNYGYTGHELSKSLNSAQASIDKQIMILDANELISLKNGKADQYEITEKGKYFLKKQHS